MCPLSVCLAARMCANDSGGVDLPIPNYSRTAVCTHQNSISCQSALLPDQSAQWAAKMLWLLLSLCLSCFIFSCAAKHPNVSKSSIDLSACLKRCMLQQLETCRVYIDNSGQCITKACMWCRNFCWLCLRSKPQDKGQNSPMLTSRSYLHLWTTSL